MVNRTSQRYYFGRGLFLFDLLVIFSIPMLIFPKNFNNNQGQLSEIHTYFGGAGNESITLKINISKANSFSGQLMINFQTPPKKVTNSFLILPFVAANLNRDFGNIHVSPPDVEGDYTILTIITSSATTDSSQVSFQILPKIIDVSLFNSDPYQKNPDYLVLLKRSDTLYTLLYNFDTQLNHNPFQTLGDLSREMIVPSQIIVKFSTDITFTSIPQVDPETYNIYNNQIHRGTYADNVFTTPIEFYYDQALKINYLLPTPLPPAADLIIFLALALVTLIPTISAFYFPENVAVILLLTIAIAVLLAVIGVGIFVGPGILIGYFADNFKFYLGDLLTYLVLVLSFFLRFFSFLRHRRNPPAPGANPPAPGANPPAPGIRHIILQKVMLAHQAT